MWCITRSSSSALDGRSDGARLRIAARSVQQTFWHGASKQVSIGNRHPRLLPAVQVVGPVVDVRPNATVMQELQVTQTHGRRPGHAVQVERDLRQRGKIRNRRGNGPREVVPVPKGLLQVRLVLKHFCGKDSTQAAKVAVELGEVPQGSEARRNGAADGVASEFGLLQPRQPLHAGWKIGHVVEMDVQDQQLIQSAGERVGKGAVQAVPLHVNLRDAVAVAALDAADAFPCAHRSIVPQPVSVAAVPLAGFHVVGKFHELRAVSGVVRRDGPGPLRRARPGVRGGQQQRACEEEAWDHFSDGQHYQVFLSRRMGEH